VLRSADGDWTVEVVPAYGRGWEFLVRYRGCLMGRRSRHYHTATVEEVRELMGEEEFSSLTA
jgi:hypothetical protein